MDDEQSPIRRYTDTGSPPASDGEDGQMSSPEDENQVQEFVYGSCPCGGPVCDIKYKMCEECLGQFLDYFADDLRHSTERLDLSALRSHIKDIRESMLLDKDELDKFWTPSARSRTSRPRDWKELLDNSYKEALLRLERVDYIGFAPEEKEEQPVVGYFFEHGAIILGLDGLPIALPRRIVERRAEAYRGIDTTRAQSRAGTT